MLNLFLFQLSNVYQDARAQGMDTMINTLKTDFENGVRKQLFMKVIFLFLVHAIQRKCFLIVQLNPLPASHFGKNLLFSSYLSSPFL